MYNFFYGLFLSGSMIIAIGAQNIHVIKNGIAKNNILCIVLICFLCDFLLMSTGVFFVGSISKISKRATLIISILSVFFLLIYGALSFRSAFKNRNNTNPSFYSDKKTSLFKSIITTLGVTLLNPHVYLDTIVIVGGISTSLTFEEKIFFITGALISSFVWFFGLGYFSKYLLNFLRSKVAWIVFDTFVGIFMWFIASTIALFCYREMMK